MHYIQTDAIWALFTSRHIILIVEITFQTLQIQIMTDLKYNETLMSDFVSPD